MAISLRLLIVVLSGKGIGGDNRGEQRDGFRIEGMSEDCKIVEDALRRKIAAIRKLTSDDEISEITLEWR